jgi:hypothetical protein
MNTIDNSFNSIINAGYCPSVIIILKEGHLPLILLPLLLQNQLVDIDVLFGPSRFILPSSGDFDRGVVVAAGIVVVVVVHVEDLLVDGLVAVVDLLAVAVATAVLLVSLWVFRLNRREGTVSMNHEGISVSFISL